MERAVQRPGRQGWRWATPSGLPWRDHSAERLRVRTVSTRPTMPTTAAAVSATADPTLPGHAPGVLLQVGQRSQRAEVDLHAFAMATAALPATTMESPR